MKLHDLKINIYADGADLKSIIKLNENPLVKGFTTNPTLMRRAGVQNYERFIKEVLEVVQGKPVSFEVLSDDPPEMKRQAYQINTWGRGGNVFIKIPIITTTGQPNYSLIQELSGNGMRVNVTAVLGLWQITEVAKSLLANVPSIISVFAGRVADTGIDTHPFMHAAKQKMRFLNLPNTALLWASVREPLNIYQADECGCEIITVPPEILSKAMDMQGRELESICRDTVRMFYTDAQAAGYTL